MQSFKGGKGANKYKMFNDSKLRKVTFRRMSIQLVESGLCQPDPTIRLCLAAGKVAKNTNREELARYFDEQGWVFYSDDLVKDKLVKLSEIGYENNVSIVTPKILSR